MITNTSGVAEACEAAYPAPDMYSITGPPYTPIDQPLHGWDQPLYSNSEGRRQIPSGLVFQKIFSPGPRDDSYPEVAGRLGLKNTTRVNASQEEQIRPIIAIPPVHPGEQQLQNQGYVMPPLVKTTLSLNQIPQSARDMTFSHEPTPITNAFFYPYGLASGCNMIPQKYAQQKPAVRQSLSSAPNTQSQGADRDNTQTQPPIIRHLNHAEILPQIQQGLGSCLAPHIYQITPNIDPQQNMCDQDFTDPYGAVQIYDQCP